MTVGIILDTYDATLEQQYLADVTQDGTVDVADVVVLVDMVLGAGYELTSQEQQQLQDALSRLRRTPQGTRVRVDGRQPSGRRGQLKME